MANLVERGKQDVGLLLCLLLSPGFEPRNHTEFRLPLSATAS